MPTKDSRDRYISPYRIPDITFHPSFYFLANSFFPNNPFRRSLRTEAVAVHCMKLVDHWRRHSLQLDGLSPGKGKKKKKHYQSTIC